jgi:hypothetical protein
VVAARTYRLLSFCYLLFSCDPCPPKMTLTSLSTRGNAPPLPFLLLRLPGLAGPSSWWGGGRGWNSRSCLMECLKSLQFRRV